MRTLPGLLLLSLLSTFATPGIGESKTRAAASMPGLMPLASAARGPADRYRFTSGLGIRVLREQTAITVSTRMSMRVSRSPYLIGAEGEFSLFSPGSVLGAYAGGWYETPVSGAPRLNVSMGIALGAAMTSQIPQLKSAVPAGFLELAVGQELDDLVTMHGQFRPGVIGNYFSFSINLAVSFRFY